VIAITAVAIAGLTTWGPLSSAASASPDTRCRHIGVGGIPTTEQCIYLPVDPEDLITLN
jgi:hypothetical protein